MNTSTRSRRTAASYRTYAEAQSAVDSLSDQAFPVGRLSIVGQNLRFVERITGRRRYAESAVQGAAAGSVFGAVFGFVLGAFSWVEPLVSGLALAMYGFVVGLLLGAVVALVGHWASAGRRDFDSVGTLEASRYDIVCDEEVAARAAAALRRRDAVSA